MLDNELIGFQDFAIAGPYDGDDGDDSARVVEVR